MYICSFASADSAPQKLKQDTIGVSPWSSILICFQYTIIAEAGKIKYNNKVDYPNCQPILH